MTPSNPVDLGNYGRVGGLTPAVHEDLSGRGLYDTMDKRLVVRRCCLGGEVPQRGSLGQVLAILAGFPSYLVPPSSLKNCARSHIRGIADVRRSSYPVLRRDRWLAGTGVDRIEAPGWRQVA
jgi:hypothetical protein